MFHSTSRLGYDDGKHKVTDEGLVIRNITQNDKGAYKCKATQVDEDITDFQEKIIQLRVQRKFLNFFTFSLPFIWPTFSQNCAKMLKIWKLENISRFLTGFFMCFCSQIARFF